MSIKNFIFFKEKEEEGLKKRKRETPKK